jgi:hypothetical protein
MRASYPSCQGSKSGRSVSELNPRKEADRGIDSVGRNASDNLGLSLESPRVPRHRGTRSSATREAVGLHTARRASRCDRGRVRELPALGRGVAPEKPVELREVARAGCMIWASGLRDDSVAKLSTHFGTVSLLGPSPHRTCSWMMSISRLAPTSWSPLSSVRSGQIGLTAFLSRAHSRCVLLRDHCTLGPHFSLGR